jgi:hypothetical protein
MGNHPAVGAAACVHVHCGTEHSFPAASALANEMAIHVPAFAALMANSPFWGPQAGKYKSYRVLKKADYCSRPRELQDPNSAMLGWGEDVCVKVVWKPTIEVRLADSASSSKVVTEYVTLLTALAVSLAEMDRKPVERPRFLESVRNRWKAAKYGLQATFEFEGKEVPVSEVLEHIIEISRPGLNRIGASLTDFEMIPRMIAKRQTQADLWSHVGTRYDDPLVFAVEAAAMMEEPGLLETYLENAPVLDPIVGPAFKDVVYAHIDRHTSYTTLSEVFSLPHFEIENALKELIREGKVREERNVNEAPRYSRRRGRRPRRSS